MKALVLNRYSQLDYQDFPAPAPAAGEVLVRVRACGVCGSDIHGWDGSTGRRQPPLIMGHEAAGVAPATALLDRFNVHTLDGFDVRRHVLGIVAYHLAPGMWSKAPTPVGDGAFRRLAAKVDLELLARVADADCRGRGGAFDCSATTWFLERARALGVQHEAPKPLLMGRHLIELGVRPGPQMGVLLKEIYEQQLDGAITTVEEAVARARERVG